MRVEYYIAYVQQTLYIKYVHRLQEYVIAIQTEFIMITISIKKYLESWKDIDLKWFFDSKEVG